MRLMRWDGRAVIVGLLLAVLGWAAAPWQFARADDQAPWKAPSRAARKKNPIAATADSIARGKAVYIAQCLPCHGPGAKGDGPAGASLTPHPPDLTSAAVASETDGELFWKITNGRKPVPSYEKTWPEEDRWSVINFVRTLGPPVTSTQPSN